MEAAVVVEIVVAAIVDVGDIKVGYGVVVGVEDIVRE